MSFESIKMMLEFLRHHRNTEIIYTFKNNNHPVALVSLKNIGIIQIVFSQLPHEISYYHDEAAAAAVIDKLIN
ncbi:hypothetical protein [Domibacillus iocasae]|uniref:Uncharacterized protein n=1 Tax=Domibacillus iocasae TaxID=1714016 RepID=A0A1E7DT00_9BACI|nr:hypothetical protein [Domibacillus iocasae]OES46149.1 hypothetical protein BA724_16350 [Domibacillus iocasae]